jgi:hypothetical protein
MAYRLKLKVNHVEVVPQIAGVTLQAIDSVLKRSDTTIVNDIPIDIDIP